MQNIKSSGLLIMAVAIMAASCSKENPREQRFAAADFDITITEDRQGHGFTYAYDRLTNMLGIDPAVQTLQELWVTEWNYVTLSVTGRDATFSGANVSSSAPDVIRVTRTDNSTYGLEYVSDGKATVTVWTSEEFSYSFDVYAKDVIELEYIIIGVDDLLGHRECRLPLRSTDPRGSYRGIEEHEGFDTCHVRVYSEYLRFQGPFFRRSDKYLGGVKGVSRYCDLLHDGATFTIGALYPENASWRLVDIQSYGFGNAVYSQLNDICHELGWPRYMAERPESRRCLEEFELDWSEVQGRRALVINDVVASRATMGPDAGKLTESPHYVFGAKIYTSFGRKQPDRSRARAMYVYCLPYTSEQCDFPPTLENPVNRDWSGMPIEQYLDDTNYWRYEP